MLSATFSQSFAPATPLRVETRQAEATRARPRMPWSRSPWPWVCCALTSVAAHAVALTLFDTARHTDRPDTAGHAVLHAMGRAPMHVRTVAAPIARAPEPASPMTVMEPDRTSPAPEYVPMPAQEASTVTASSGPSMAAADADMTEDAMAAPAADIYFPRSELTVTPAPRAPVILAAPDDGSAAARRTGVLSLFIDEAGRVQRIVPEEPRLPSRYEEAARAAFMAAVFQPAQRDGTIVKSRIRIEVVFDTTSLDAP